MNHEHPQAFPHPHLNPDNKHNVLTFTYKHGTIVIYEYKHYMPVNGSYVPRTEECCDYEKYLTKKKGCPVKERHIKGEKLRKRKRFFFFSAIVSLSCGYKKIWSPNVIQLQLTDLGDVNVCREIDSGELKGNTHKKKNMIIQIWI